MELALFSATLWKVIDFFRLLAAILRGEKGHVSGVVTQLAAWIGGVIMVIWAAHSGAVQDLVFPGTSVALGSLDGPSQALLGVAIASVASVGVDVKQAIDGSDSAVKPPVLPKAP